MAGRGSSKHKRAEKQDSPARSQSPDRREDNFVHIGIVQNGTLHEEDKWLLPRNVPLRTLLEVFCQKHKFDAAKVTFSTFEGWNGTPHALPTTINVDLTPHDLCIEDAAIFDAIVVPDTQIVLYVLHPLFNEQNKRMVRIKTRMDSTVRSMMDTSFAAFELPSVYRGYVEFEFEGLLFEPSKHGDHR